MDWTARYQPQIAAFAREIMRLTRIDCPGEYVWLKAEAGAKPLVLELQRRIVALGSKVDLDVYFDEASLEALRAAPMPVLLSEDPVQDARAAYATRYVIVDCERQGSGASDVDAERRAAVSRLRRHATRRLDALPCCRTLFPNPDYAARAHMDWSSYLDFFFSIVSVDLDALYQRYRCISHMLNTGDVLRIESPNAQLRFDVGGRRFVSDDCLYWNLPDGEIFTSPVETETSGYIRFDSPQYFYADTPVEGLELWFEQGRVVGFQARRGADVVERLLAMDAGAAVAGEIGIGINDAVDKLTGDITFDEKMAGTIHVALGAAYPECGGVNESALHWDLTCDIRDGGRIWIDEQLIFSGGRPLSDEDFRVEAREMRCP